MEKQFFDWEDWDSWDEGSYIFYKCRLKQSVGTFMANVFIDSIAVDYQKGVMEFYDRTGESVIGSYKLQLSVVKD